MGTRAESGIIKYMAVELSSELPPSCAAVEEARAESGIDGPGMFVLSIAKLQLPAAEDELRVEKDIVGPGMAAEFSGKQRTSPRPREETVGEPRAESGIDKCKPPFVVAMGGPLAESGIVGTCRATEPSNELRPFDVAVDEHEPREDCRIAACTGVELSSGLPAFVIVGRAESGI